MTLHIVHYGFLWSFHFYYALTVQVARCYGRDSSHVMCVMSVILHSPSQISEIYCTCNMHVFVRAELTELGDFCVASMPLVSVSVFICRIRDAMLSPFLKLLSDKRRVKIHANSCAPNVTG